MQQVWRKRLRNTAWIALVAVTLVLLVSAVNTKNHKVCTGIEVSFTGDGSNFFIDEKSVIATLKSFGSIKGKPVSSINLNILENNLKDDKWIANAELFFDNKQVLQVIIEEKQPVARVFTVTGESFYIDSSCRKLPLSEKLTARIPMFTGFPSDREKLSKPDSQLLASVKELAMFVQADEFWKAQVSQVDITPDGFEMIPTVGNHLVQLGKDGEWRQKFDRLYSFYKQVWIKVGFERYEKVDVRFNGQVVATVKGAKTSAIDSVKARLAYENLIAEVKDNSEEAVKENENRSIRNKEENNSLPVNRAVESNREKEDDGRTTLNNSKVKNEVRSEKGSEQVRQLTRRTQENDVTASKSSEDKRVPKAIMKKPASALKAERKG